MHSYHQNQSVWNRIMQFIIYELFEVFRSNQIFCQCIILKGLRYWYFFTYFFFLLSHAMIKRKKIDEYVRKVDRSIDVIRKIKFAISHIKLVIIIFFFVIHFEDSKIPKKQNDWYLFSAENSFQSCQKRYGSDKLLSFFEFLFVFDNRTIIYFLDKKKLTFWWDLLTWQKIQRKFIDRNKKRCNLPEKLTNTKYNKDTKIRSLFFCIIQYRKTKI